MPQGGNHFHTACRRNRLQFYALAIGATLTAAHMIDRIAAGATACAIEQPAQCPGGSQ